MKKRGRRPGEVAARAAPLLLALTGLPVHAAERQVPVGAGSCPLLQGPSASALPAYDTAEHDRQLQRWHAGEIETSQLLAMLSAWRGGHPNHPRLQADLLEVAARAAAFDCALDGLTTAGIAQLPDYALPAVILGARSTRRTDLQGAAVQALKQRHPDSWAPAWREAQWLIDLGRNADARAALDALGRRADAAERQHRIELLELEGALAEAGGEPLLALLRYSELLRLAPDHAYAQQFSLSTLTSLRGAALAVADADAWRSSPPSQSRQVAGLQADLLASRYRDAIAQRDYGTGTERFAALDQVIDDYDALLQRAGAQARQAAPDDAAAWASLLGSLRADSLLALSERGRHLESVNRYEQWQSDRQSIAAYGLAAAAGSYAWLRRSDLAVPLYEQALRESGEAAAQEISLSLVYAYIDTGRFDEAQALLDRRGEAIPPYLRQSPRRLDPNHEFDGHQTLRANVALSTDRLEAGERLLDELVASAPLNADMQIGQVRARQLRDRPEAARGLMAGVRSDHPESLAVQLAYADLLLDQGDYGAARAEIEAMEHRFPQDGRVLRLRERFERRTAGWLEARVGADRDGGTLASREARVDARLYSPILADRFRVWGRQNRQNARLDGNRPSSFRTGVGALYERHPFWVQAEIHRESLHGRAGLEVDAAWRASDHWRLRGHYDSFSLDTPWRARTQDVRMARLDLGASWIQNESRRIDLSIQHGRFSDGNRRNEWVGAWYERWISQPVWQFSTTAEWSAGRHAKSDVSYFSPRSYHGAQIWGRAQWLTWKRDQRRLLQVLEVGGGVYAQAGHGSMPVRGIKLTHEWSLGRGATVSYGVSWMRRPYDGVQEIQRAIFIGFSVPLR